MDASGNPATLTHEERAKVQAELAWQVLPDGRVAWTRPGEGHAWMAENLFDLPCPDYYPSCEAVKVPARRGRKVRKTTMFED